MEDEQQFMITGFLCDLFSRVQEIRKVIFFAVPSYGSALFFQFQHRRHRHQNDDDDGG